ncbi:MAG: Si-specific NAD(P)(+) transhydrogenase [Alphaproteobacteria bacterium]|nr:Si-specific NAD(P)(+) transhydrogenase [Alphaproteobacteria bacterium]
MSKHYDLIVVGSGPAGKRGAIQAAKLGKDVLVVEKNFRVGGVSVHTGTIPSKTLRETVINLTGWRERGFYGVNYRVKKNISAEDLKTRLNMTLGHEIDVLENQFARNAVETIQGDAAFADDKTITVTDHTGSQQKFTADKFLLAVGTKPYKPDHIPFDGEQIIDSDDILALEKLPRTLTVVGAGVIGVEYATIFSALDIPVTVIDPRDPIMEFLDHELTSELVHELKDRKVIFHLGCTVENIEKNDIGQCVVKLDSGRVVKTHMVLFAAGRVGATDSIGLENCGLEADKRGRIEVDPNTFETKVPHIFAAGDVIGFPALASTSMEQGRLAACHAFNHHVTDPPKFFPYGIYAIPEMSTVGQSEHEVREDNVQYECGIARFRETSRGQIMGIKSGMLKMIFSLADRKLLGVHIIGEGATELIHIGQAVMHFGGTVDYFVESTFNYPTLAEAYKIAALDAWNRM